MPVALLHIFNIHVDRRACCPFEYFQYSCRLIHVGFIISALIIKPTWICLITKKVNISGCPHRSYKVLKNLIVVFLSTRL